VNAVDNLPLPPSTAKVKKGWKYTYFLSLRCVHGMQVVNLSFTSLPLMNKTGTYL
jgi:hypothetical protein